MNNIASVNGVPTCGHPNKQTTVGPTTTQVNHHCPDCGSGWTTFPAATPPLMAAVPAQTGEVARLADKLKTWIDLNVGRAAEAKILSEDANRLAALAHSPTVASPAASRAMQTSDPKFTMAMFDAEKVPAGTPVTASPALVSPASSMCSTTRCPEQTELFE